MKELYQENIELLQNKIEDIEKVNKNIYMIKKRRTNVEIIALGFAIVILVGTFFTFCYLFLVIIRIF